MSDGALTQVRWLATKLVPSVSDVPLPVLATQCLRDRDMAGITKDYLLDWVVRSQPGSVFAARSKKFRWLPGTLMLRLMAWAGYDGLLYFSGERIIGHGFFQRRGDALHGFSTAVEPSQEGGGFSVVFLLDCVAYAACLPRMCAIRIGTGGNNTTRRLLVRVREYEDELGWRVSEDGWVRFRE